MCYPADAPSIEHLINTYGYHGEHPSVPFTNYQDAVACGLTRLGYWEWVLLSIGEENRHALYLQSLGK